MKALTRADYELLTEAQRVIQSNYDEAEQNHTVGAAVRCKSGNVYAGVNVYSLHGACAEQVAIGTAGKRRRGDRSALRQLPPDVE